jgi:Flp pilus assembly protein TadG
MHWGDKRGAVAPLVAISLFALVAAGGLAFDYARMAAMDTELQNAADQAALAAASQLDRGTGACARASSAAVNFVENSTLFANDAGGQQVTVPPEPTCDATGSIRFYLDKAKTTAATTDAEANFVEVTVNARTAQFALTPIVAAFNSGLIDATAYAGMGSAICGVEPLMMCNPDEPNGNNDPNYPFSVGSRIGIGIELVDDERDVPGNFGFLDSGLGGSSGILKVLSYDNQPANCLPIDGVVTKPGFNASVMDGLNTRFDIVSSNDCPGGGPCSPSLNSRKDLVRGNSCNWNEPSATAAEQASTTPPRYRPLNAQDLDPTITPVIMGHPRDRCHAWDIEADCGLGNRLGNGEWDRAAYFRSNHPGLDWQSEPGLGANVTRYQTYLWEVQDLANRLEPKDTLNNPVRTAYGTPEANKCHAPGLMPTAGGPDRRLITAAVLNCKAFAVRGKKPAPVLKWIDLFLVEPAENRVRCSESNDASGCKTKYTDKREVYVELVGERDTPAFGGSNTTIFRRDVPYLIE